METENNVYKFKISKNGTSMNRYCINYTMIAHPSTSTFGQWESALASAIIPSVPIPHSSKLQHETCIDGISCAQLSLATLKPEEYILFSEKQIR